MTTRFAELKQRYNYAAAIADVPNPLPPGEVCRISLPVSLAYLQAACSRIEQTYGLRGFTSSDGVAKDPDYASISLSYNPACNEPENYSTLGSSKLTQREHYFATPETLAKVGGARDSYYDTYGFRFPTRPASIEISELIISAKRSAIRARISTIRGGRSTPAGFFWGWHKDEPVFENLRVNIHVTASPANRIQIMREDRMPQGPHEPISEHVFEPGYGYSWDTNLPHRACNTTPDTADRTAIILGFSPWFDYNPETDEWAPNEFFGKKHPLQMLVDGDVL
jgi:hypothetical protein